MSIIEGEVLPRSPLNNLTLRDFLSIFLFILYYLEVVYILFFQLFMRLILFNFFNIIIGYIFKNVAYIDIIG
jgi:hypothetical protein